jgi:polysaccharide biosynthesis transport protein
MDFIYLLRVLLKRKWIVLGATVLAAALAYFLTRNEQRKFRSSSRISTGFAIKEVVSVNEEFDPWAAETKFENAIEEFQTPQVLNLLGYDLILHELSQPASSFRTLGEHQKQTPDFKAVNIETAKRIFRTKLDSLQMLSPYNPEEKKLIDFQKLYGYDYKSLDKNLNVYRVSRTDYLQIDFLSENPELSAYIVNNIFNQYSRYFTKVRKINVTESIDTLKSIMDKRKQDLDVKNALLSKYGGGSMEDGTTILGVAGDLRKALEEEKSKRTQKEYELERVKQKLAAFNNPTGSNTNAVSGSDILAAKKAKEDAYDDWQQDQNNQSKEDKYNKALSNYITLLNASENTSKTSTGNKSTETKSELLDKKADLEFAIKSYNDNIVSYTNQINLLEGRASNTQSNVVTVETLKNERNQANTDYLDAKRKYDAARDVSGSSINNFRQIVMGQPAFEPEPSKRMMMVGMAGAAALITCILIIIFLTYLDSSIKTPIIFSKIVNLKLISLVNFMDLKNKSLEDIVANRHQNETVTDRNKFNAFRESIRKLRYEIETTGKKVFLFTSTKKGMGKTTLIQALSYSMSLSKKKILIIDTNFCNPDLTVQLNADPVLEKIIPLKANGVSLVDQVKKFSKDIGVGTVFAIGAEGGDYTPSEILPRENILHHLQALTAEFDYIFLEGPPLNDFSDSKELAQYVDGVIAVFSATHIIKQIDKQSIAFFKELNGKFCGSILNMVDLKNVNVS